MFQNLLKSSLFMFSLSAVVFSASNNTASKDSLQIQPKQKGNLVMASTTQRREIQLGNGFTVRIIEIPKVKMVRSGGSDLAEFDKWWSKIHNTDRYAIFPRDFMWHNPKLNKEEWLYALPAGTYDIRGYDTLEFLGGLYAVTTCKESELGDASGQMREWLKTSDLFVLDDQMPDRYDMVHIITPKVVKDRIGYNQMDFFFPIRMK